MDPHLERIEKVFRSIADPFALLVELFAHAPVGLQIYDANGRSLIVNVAFLELFGSEPPPEYNVLRDEIAARAGVLDLLRRGFAGETVRTPPIWYDPRQLEQVHVTEGRRVAIETMVIPLRNRAGAVEHVAIVVKDVTAETELRAQHKRLNALFEHVVDAVYLQDQTGAVKWVSPSVERVLGYSIDEQLRTHPTEVLHPDDVEPTRAVFDRLLAHPGEVVRAEYRVRHKDGSWRWMEATARNLLDDPEIGAIVTNHRDVSERRAMDDDLRASRMHLLTTLRSIGDAVITTDAQARVELINAVGERLTGWSQAEARGRPLSEIFSIADESTGEPVEDPVARVLREGKIVGLANHTVLRARDGTERAIADSGAPIQGADGRVSGVVLVFRDVTDERAVERKLRDSEQLHRALFEGIPKPVLVHDPETGRLLAVNEAASRIYGHPREDLLAMRYADLEVAADGVAPARDPPTPVSSSRHRCRDGRVLDVEVHTSAITFAGRRAWQSIVRDVTLERQLREQALLADRLAAFGSLAAGLAHEINNPLAALLGNLELVRRQLADHALDPGLEDALARLADVHDAGVLLRSIAKDVLMFARGGDEQGTVVLVDVLDAACRTANSEIRHRARLVKDYTTLPAVLGSEGRWGQVFLNLLINAAQAFPPGTATANEIRIVGRSTEAEVVVEIHDTGPGIDPAMLARIFEPFVSTKAAQGTGLGLWISQKIAQQAGGRIEVQSRLGAGTVFSVFMVPMRDPAGRAPARVPTSSGTSSAKILLVDDDDAVLALLRRVFEPQHTVTAMRRAGEVLDAVAGGATWDVVLCDLLMPDVTGMELYRRLRELAPSLAQRFVFLSGGLLDDEARRFVDQSGVPWIAKPFTLDELTSTVAAMLHDTSSS